jgi:ribose 5-phosphate isomerase A
MASHEYIIIAEGSKKRDSLSGVVPVEYMSFGSSSTLKKLSQIAPVTQRMKNGTFFISDNGNPIADLFIEHIEDIEKLDFLLCSIPGVVGTGLFYNLPRPTTIVV